MIEKTTIKYSSIKVSSDSDKACTFTIFSFVKFFIKSTTSSLVYYNLFVFNIIMKNEKTMLKYYKKKIVISLFETIYLLTLNTYKAIIMSLELSLQSLHN